MMRQVAMGLVLLSGALSAPRAAEACGGCFNPPTAVQVVTDHRMVLSLSRERTVLWDQFRYSGRPEDFSWILPIRNGPGVVVEEADNLFLSAMDGVTAPLLTRPQPPSRFCGGGGFAFAGASAPSTADRSGSPESVSVINERVVGPYQVVTLASSDAMALRTWLRNNGYAVPAPVEPVIDHYVGLRMDFIALRLRPSADVSQMKPVRVITPGYNPTLPLRMIAAGVADKVGLLLTVISESRIEAMNFPNAEVTDSDLSYDFDNPTTNLGDDFIRAFNAVNRRNNNRAWITESASNISRSTVDNAMRFCGTSLGGFGPSMTCELDGRVMPLDTQVAFESFRDQAFVTRLRADLALNSLTQDLQLAASDRGVRLRAYNYGTILNRPPDPCSSNFDGCSARNSSAGSLGAVGAAIAAIAALSVTRRRRTTRS
jgi:hypothetical protein